MLLDEGTYLGEIIDAGLDTSSQKKTPYLGVTFSVTHQLAATFEPDAEPEWEELDEPVNRYVNLYLSEKAWGMSEKRLKALGFNGNFDEPKFENPQHSLECVHEEYDGKTRDKIDLAGMSGARERVAPAKTEIRKFNAMWKAKAS